jgi:hypothetical protein
MVFFNAMILSQNFKNLQLVVIFDEITSQGFERDSHPFMI